MIYSLENYRDSWLMCLAKYGRNHLETEKYARLYEEALRRAGIGEFEGDGSRSVEGARR